MFSNYDDNTLKIISEAENYTKSHYKLGKVGTEAFLYVMFFNPDSLCHFLLEDYRVSCEEIENIITQYVIIRNNNAKYTDRLLEVFKMAEKIANENDSEQVLEEHLLFALLVVRDTIFLDEIKKLNLNAFTLIEDIKGYFNIKEDKEIDNYSVNLSALAKDNKLTKLIGREDYLERMQIVLKRKNKNSILLIGNAGVGKTALVEGLAQLLIKEKNKQEIISINIASIVANTKYRGDFEARINKVLNEVINREDVIVFIDEIHTIVGAGSADNTLDVANILKPYLARSNFRCIGATTIDEYHKTIVKDKALARRFQTIFVNEPNGEESLKILQGIADSFADFHKVKIPSELLSYIIDLCSKKLINRRFPDKAIDLLDEATTIAKVLGSSELKINHIDQAYQNMSGVNKGSILKKYRYQELEEYYLDNYLGSNERKNLVSIFFTGNENNLHLLLDEIRQGFGICEEMVLDLDLSNFSESYSISSLFGSPPGYVGYDDGGLISEHFSKYPFQVLILRNFAEGHPEIIRMINNMLTTGFAYDKKGRLLSTKNCAFILTGKKENYRLGFLSNHQTNDDHPNVDLLLSNKEEEFLINNPYLDLFKSKGYNIIFDNSDFEAHKLEYKKGFYRLISNYELGNYQLKFNEETSQIDIITV